MSQELAAFNTLPDTAALAQLLGCCHSHSWAARMLAARPFADVATMLECAEAIWATVTEADLLEAFSGHARIGDLDELRDKYSRAQAEQGQVAHADEAVLQALLQLNAEYEARHGFIFIVCATGKSAEQMLAILRERLPLSRAQELANAAAEQAKITAIRARALFAADSSAS